MTSSSPVDRGTVEPEICLGCGNAFGARMAERDGRLIAEAELDALKAERAQSRKWRNLDELRRLRTGIEKLIDDWEWYEDNKGRSGEERAYSSAVIAAVESLRALLAGSVSPDDALMESKRHGDASYPSPVPPTEPRRGRYSHCDVTCTVDCGHCKGQGPPTENREADR